MWNLEKREIPEGGFRQDSPAPGEECQTRGGGPYDGAPVEPLALDEAAFVGILPDRQFRARRAPGVHDLLVRALAVGQPVEEIEDQVFHYGIFRHWSLPYLSRRAAAEWGAGVAADFVGLRSPD